MRISMVFPLQTSNKPLAGFTIMVNPGHGVRKSNGKMDDGAVGKLLDGTKVLESELNDTNALIIQKKLEGLGAKVLYVKNMHVTEIKELENRIKPDFFIALHLNAHENKTYCGENVYAKGEEGRKALDAINKRLKADKTIFNNRVNHRRSNELKVLDADKSIPAVLVEYGYISNSKDLKILNTPKYQEVAAQNVVDGISEFLLAKQNEAQTLSPLGKIKTIEAKLQKITKPIPFSALPQAAN